MTKRFIVLIGALAVSASVILYLLHFVIFRDAHHILIYLLGDLAFMPLEVYLVVIVIERLLAQQERKALHSKLNMVIGAFFMAVGNRLLADLLTNFREQENLYKTFAVSTQWQRNDYKLARALALKIKLKVEFNLIDLEALKGFLCDQRPFLLSLMENPNLLEREAFSELLWAITHLAEELEARKSLKSLSETDLKHLEGDINRFYDRLVFEWLNYAEHLQTHYPYFFSLLVRTHPFQHAPTPEVKS